MKKVKKIVKKIPQTTTINKTVHQKSDKKTIITSNQVNKTPMKKGNGKQKVAIWKDTTYSNNQNTKIVKPLEKKIRKEILASSKKAKNEQDLRQRQEKERERQITHLKVIPKKTVITTTKAKQKKMVKKKPNLSLIAKLFKKKAKKEIVKPVKKEAKKPVITSTIILTPVKKQQLNPTSLPSNTIKPQTLKEEFNQPTPSSITNEIPVVTPPIKMEKRTKELKQKKKEKKIFTGKFVTIIILICIFSTILTICTSKILQRKKDEKSIHNQVVEIQKVVNVEEVTDNDNTTIIEPVEEIPKFNPYWDYINMNLINVDFNSLKETNDQVKGWIQVNGTNINYPFVQASDNKYYLTHSFNKSYNLAGWVFLDYRNDLSQLNKNTIIYAHGRIDKTMFGSLKNILTNGFLNDPNNFVVKLSTEYENTLWQVFSVYRIPLTSDYLKTTFVNDKQFLDFTKMLTDRSAHDFGTTVNETDQILTLSTCYNDDGERVVLHAKLIKKEIRTY